MAILVSDVNTRVRSLVGDLAGSVYSDAVLLPYVNSAYEEVATAMRSANVSIFKRTSSAIAIASGTKLLGRTGGATQYPSDMIRPLELVERVSGSGLYVRMSQSDGVMEDRAATTLMQEWDWRDDTLYFPGASGNVQVIIEYEADLAALSGNSSPLLIQNCLNAVAYTVAAAGTRIRDGAEAAGLFQAKADAEVKRLIDSEAGSKIAMGGRWGPQDQGSTVSVQSVLRFAAPLINEYVADGLKDADLLPFVRMAYRNIARRLRAEGVSVFRRTSAAITISAGTKALLRSSGTQYPADLLRPLELVERVSGTGTYVRMSQSEGLFEDRATTALMQEWEWKDDGIRFVGASGDVQVIIEYEAALAELLTPGDAILIPDSYDTIAYLAAAYALAARPNVDSTKLEAQAEKAVGALVQSEVALKRAMGGRWGTQDQVTPTVGRVTAQHVLRVASPLINATLAKKLTDPEILEFMRPAYQDVAKAFRGLGLNVFLREATVIIAANVTSISRTSTPPLPSDLVRPHRVQVQEVSEEVPNTNRWHIINTSQYAFQNAADDTMGVWQWRDDKISFSPSTIGYNVQIQYEAILPDITKPQDQIQITDGVTPVAFMTAAYAHLAYGGAETSAGMKARAMEIIVDIVNNEKAAAAAGTGNALYPND